MKGVRSGSALAARRAAAGTTSVLCCDSNFLDVSDRCFGRIRTSSKPFV